MAMEAINVLKRINAKQEALEIELEVVMALVVAVGLKGARKVCTHTRTPYGKLG